MIAAVKRMRIRYITSRTEGCLRVALALHCHIELLEVVGTVETYPHGESILRGEGRSLRQHA